MKTLMTEALFWIREYIEVCREIQQVALKVIPYGVRLMFWMLVTALVAHEWFIQDIHKLREKGFIAVLIWSIVVAVLYALFTWIMSPYHPTKRED